MGTWNFCSAGKLFNTPTIPHWETDVSNDTLGENFDRSYIRKLGPLFPTPGYMQPTLPCLQTVTPMYTPVLHLSPRVHNHFLGLNKHSPRERTPPAVLSSLVVNFWWWFLCWVMTLSLFRWSSWLKGKDSTVAANRRLYRTSCRDSYTNCMKV